MNDNIGRIIKDSFCNGFFGREYDHEGSVIIAEGDEWIVIRKQSGVIQFASFQRVEFQRDNEGNPLDLHVVGVWDKQEFLDKWCEEEQI